jgi:hypothetical protein
VDLIIISLKIYLFSKWYSWKIAELALRNNHSLTYYCKFVKHISFSSWHIWDIMHHSIMVMSTSRKVIFCWVSITWIRQTTYSWHLALCFIISGWFLLFKYIMTRTRYVWRTYNNKWVNDCCASSAVDRWIDPRSGQTKDYEIGICCFSTKHT